ncbi:fibrinogen-like YCDxxxxGGGW domain-containing protein [Microbacterium gubbeenense]|uniref:fibrinogen-like YCDxxxxGGGW domain-containing protein n=1 Tax=Microbacterium gubbeenense TaxID=159896 RepID=UPI003F97BA0F
MTMKIHIPLGLLAASLLVASAFPAAADETALPAPDGLTEATAAASCWEVAQLDPDAPSGDYWIATPELGSAEQFYCDQETDGGGWVLVAHGRERWSESILGSGTPAQVRENITGPAAFSPRQLSGEIIDGLVGGGRIDELADGVRLVRATNAQGTAWQDVRFRFASPRDGWTWHFDNAQRIGSYSFDGAAGSGGSTSNFGSGDGTGRVRTITGSAEGWAMGFGYGRNVTGSPDGASYLWASANGGRYARPFTQVFLRPQILSENVYDALPAGGTEAETGVSVTEGFALPQSWGVAGLGAGPSTREGSNEVSAFTESGDAVFVGGNFTTVQRSAGGQGAADQSYLAAFHRDSGEWISSFRPTFDNQVKALAALPGGRIAAGGFFSEVNGEPHEGLVVLDAATGEIDAAFTGRLINYLSGGVASVRTLDVQDGWLYAAGSFTHAASDGGGQAYTRSAARFDVTTGDPDAWNPELNGTVMSIDASARGDRVYAAGFFSQSQGRPADKAAAISTTDESLAAWPVVFSNRAGGRTGYQQAVLEVGDRVWLGGSEHSLMSYDRDTLDMLSANITLPGGDFQAIASDGQAVYAGCHCFGMSYSGATAWPSIGTAWTDAEAIYASGAWSAATGERLASFNGSFNARAGAGAWALFVDSAGTLWQGGDLRYSVRDGYVNQWSGGFVRHRASDVTAPSTPEGFQARAASDGVSLSWDASTDDRGVSGYQVLRTDRVVATVEDTHADLPAAPAGTVYAVRAVDDAGNRSASTVPVAAEAAPDPEPDPEPDPAPEPDPDPDPEPSALIAAGATWATFWSTDEVAEGWAGTEFDDSAWLTGAAPIGWGTGDIATLLDRALDPSPITSYHRAAFEVPDGSSSVHLAVRSDDGVVVYIDGTEVLRDNLDAGTVTAGTRANQNVGSSSAPGNIVELDAPDLAAGGHTVAVEVHSNYRSAVSHSFEMTVSAP